MMKMYKNINRCFAGSMVETQFVLFFSKNEWLRSLENWITDS